MADWPQAAVLFDLEGVIIDTEPLWDEVSGELLSRRGIRYEKGVVKHLMMGKTLKEGVAILQGKFGLVGDIDELTHERRRIAREIFSRDVAFMPGAEAFVRAVATRFKIAVATSMERGFFLSVDAKLKLTALFAGHIYSIEDIGFISKPNPDIFLHAAKSLDADPERCLVLEDSPNGVLAAKRAGMKCVALTTSTARERLGLADTIVDSFDELAAANIEDLLGARCVTA